MDTLEISRASSTVAGISGGKDAKPIRILHYLLTFSIRAFRVGLVLNLCDSRSFAAFGSRMLVIPFLFEPSSQSLMACWVSEKRQVVPFDSVLSKRCNNELFPNQKPF